MNSAPDQPEVRRLEESLRLCRLELAQRHAELEALQEERAALRSRCEDAERRAVDLETALDEHLSNTPSSRNPAQRLRSALQRPRQET